MHANAECLNQVSDLDPVLMTLASMPAPVPEPGTWALMALGLAGLVARARRWEAREIESAGRREP